MVVFYSELDDVWQGAGTQTSGQVRETGRRRRGWRRWIEERMVSGRRGAQTTERRRIDGTGRHVGGRCRRRKAGAGRVDGVRWDDGRA